VHRHRNRLTRASYLPWDRSAVFGPPAEYVSVDAVRPGGRDGWPCEPTSGRRAANLSLERASRTQVYIDKRRAGAPMTFTSRP
jgi:hypothetical protein